MIDNEDFEFTFIAKALGVVLVLMVVTPIIQRFDGSSLAASRRRNLLINI